MTDPRRSRPAARRIEVLQVLLNRPMQREYRSIPDAAVSVVPTEQKHSQIGLHPHSGHDAKAARFMATMLR